MSSAAWDAAVHQVYHEDVGLLVLAIVQPADGQELERAALAGDACAVTLLPQIQEFVAFVQTAPITSRARCCGCGAEFVSGQFAVAVVTPDISDQAAGVGVGVCPKCGSTISAIKATLIRVLRYAWPGLRPIQITHPEGGRA